MSVLESCWMSLVGEQMDLMLVSKEKKQLMEQLKEYTHSK